MRGWVRGWGTIRSRSLISRRSSREGEGDNPQNPGLAAAGGWCCWFECLQSYPYLAAGGGRVYLQRPPPVRHPLALLPFLGASGSWWGWQP